MKSILHYTMMLAAVALLASCEKNPADDNDPTPTEPATLEINENLVQANNHKEKRQDEQGTDKRNGNAGAAGARRV